MKRRFDVIWWMDGIAMGCEAEDETVNVNEK